MIKEFMRRKSVRLFACAVLMSSLPLYAQFAEEPVLEYILAPGEMAHRGTASVIVFADGRVRVRRPNYWRNSGTFESQLPRERIADLLKLVRSVNLTELSPDTLFQAHAETDGKSRLFEVHDADSVTLVIRQLGIENQVIVMAPAAQLDRLPNQEALSSFVDIDAKFRELLSSTDDARRVTEKEMAQ